MTNAPVLEAAAAREFVPNDVGRLTAPPPASAGGASASYCAFLRDGDLLHKTFAMQTKPTHPLELPPPIASYFANETTDPQAVADCFDHEAVVVDERHEHRGRAAIAAWNAAAFAKYSFTTELLAAETDGPRLTVRAKVSGNFPGSPVELRFRFALEGGLIARLEISP